MKKHWLLLADQFDAMRPRERLMVFIALVAVLAGGFYVLLLNPALARYQLARQQLQQSELALNTLNQQELLLTEASSRDPDQDERARLQALDQQVTALRSQLTGPAARLATPEKMNALLRALIAGQKNLHLLSISSGEVQDLLAAPQPGAELQAPASKGALSLYRHSVKLVLQGDYAALSSYLRQLETLPWQMEAAQVQIRSENWPQATLSLTLHINSLERAWLAF